MQNIPHIPQLETTNGNFDAEDLKRNQQVLLLLCIIPIALGYLDRTALATTCHMSMWVYAIPVICSTIFLLCSLKIELVQRNINSLMHLMYAIITGAIIWSTGSKEFSANSSFLPPLITIMFASGFKNIRHLQWYLTTTSIFLIGVQISAGDHLHVNFNYYTGNFLGMSFIIYLFIKGKLEVSGKLSNSEKLLRSVIEKSDDAFLVLRLNSGFDRVTNSPFGIRLHNAEIVDCNEQALNMFGAKNKLSLVGAHLGNFLSEIDSAKTTIGSDHGRFEIQGFRIDGQEIWCAIALTHFDPDSKIAVMQVADVSIARENLLLNKLLQEVAVAANSSATIAEAATIVLEHICIATGWPVGHLYIAEEDDRLHPTGVWHIDDSKQFQKFKEVTAQTIFEPGIGLPGRVLTSGEPAWIVDVTKDDNFPRAKEVIGLNVAGAFGFPISIEGEVVAVLEFFAELPANPNWSLLEVMTHIGNQLGIVVDRQRKENEMMQAKEIAEAANSAKSMFLANMSHEIRTPMNGIIGMTAIALGKKLEASVRENLQQIRLSADALLQVINDILDFSKIEAGKLGIEMIDFRFRQVMSATVSMFRMRAHEKELKLSLHISDEIPSIMRGDPSRLRQVITNLVGNAIKFTTEGAIHVDVEIREKTEEIVQIEVSVSDTGIGIPQEKLEDIFENFSQSDASTTRKYGGTGLGLTISSQLVELMGGKLSVESEVGIGSKFCFTANLKQSTINESEFSQQEIAISAQAVRNLRVLLVEDNNVNRMIAEHALRGFGHEVISAVNGKVALQIIADVGEENIDLILMDIMMPEMDGFEATAEIRANESRPIPIIAMTANAMEGDRERCLSAGMNGYISKPFKPEQLSTAIAEMFG